MDLFTLPNFDEDEDDDYEDYEPPVRDRRKRKSVPLIEDDDNDREQDNGDEEEEEDNRDDDKDEDYEKDDEDEEDEENDDEDDDKEITLQRGKADERKKKSAVRAKRADIDVVVEEMPRGSGQWCANVEQATEFRNYIKSIMKMFEEHVKRENR